MTGQDDEIKHGRRTIEDWIMNAAVVVLVLFAALATYSLFD